MAAAAREAVRSWSSAATFTLVAMLVLGALGSEQPGAAAPPPQPEQRERFTVLTRLHFDTPYLHHFVDWYVGLGFDRVVAIQSDAAMNNTYAPHPSGKLLVLAAPEDKGDALLQDRAFTQHVYTRSARDWVLTIDSDEFLVLSRPTIQEYVDAVRAGRPEQEQRRLASMHFRWAVAHDARPHCAQAMAPAVLAAQPVQGVLVRQMARADAIGRQYDSHRFVLTKARYFYTHFEGAVKVQGDKRARAGFPHSQRPFRHSAVLHVATRSLANMMTKHLAHAHAVAARRAGQPSSHPGARVFVAQYNLSTAALVGLVHELGARTPLPPGADGAERPEGRDAADRSAHAELVARFVLAFGPKGGDALAGAFSLLDGDQAAWDCGYQPAELSAALRRLLESSNVPREQPLCDAEQEKRALRALLDKEGVTIDEYERFAALLADAFADVLGAARRNPFAPLPAELDRVIFLGKKRPATTRAPASSKQGAQPAGHLDSDSTTAMWPRRAPSLCPNGRDAGSGAGE